MSTQAPEAPVTEAPPAEAPPAPAPEATRVPAGEPGAGQFVPTPPAAPPAAPAAPAQQEAPKPTAPPEPDWKAEAAKARADAAKAKEDTETWKKRSRQQEDRSKANHRDLQNRDAWIRAIADKVGVEFDDKPDPEELTRKLEEAQTTAKRHAVELAVFQHAVSANANAPALLDSREFMARTAALDPEAADFTSQLADLVTDAATQPRYAAPAPPRAPQPADNYAPPAQPPAAPPAPASGADFSGAPGGNRLWTQADYDHWTDPANDRDGAIVARAIKDGLLVGIGIGKPKSKGRR
jgi:hypothetical protein